MFGSKFNIGKYKNILVSIALFLLLDASVLILNFYISFEISEDAVSINLAGRQRMLSQRMTKSLLDIDYAQGDSERSEKAYNELQLSRNLFNETINAFDRGGEVTGADGSKTPLNQANDINSRAALESAKPLWRGYSERIDNVLALQNTNLVSEQGAALAAAIGYGQENNLALLKLMNDLTVSLEQVASSKAERLRLIQTAGISMALINFFIILFHFIGQLRKGDEVLEEARKETTDILSTVNEGLFLIHDDFTIGAQRSERLEDIIDADISPGVSFDRLLKNIVADRDLESAQGFLRLLFNPKIKEKLIGDLNPLEKIQVNINDGIGGYDTKYLSFDFKRVVTNGEIVNVLATVNDITDKVVLEKELQQAKENNEKQIEMLTSILHANPSMLKAFLENAYLAFARINNLFKKPARTKPQFIEKINEIFIEVHNFKGEASALDLEDFVTMAHEFEDELTFMRESKDVKGQDFLSLTVRLDKFISYAQSVTGLVEKLSSFGDFSPPATADESRNWDHLDKFVGDLSSKYQKEVMLVSSGLNESPITGDLKDTINSICIQFIRNSIVHGIETPEERTLMQKKSQGRIDIRLSSTPDGTLEMLFRDDGSGFDFDKLRQRALEMDKWTEEEIDHWDHKQLLSLIFTPGFSTAEDINDDAGRGMGMDVVMKKIKSHKGKINISHKPGQFARFVISFPVVALQQAA